MGKKARKTAQQDSRGYATTSTPALRADAGAPAPAPAALPDDAAQPGELAAVRPAEDPPPAAAQENPAGVLM